MIAEDFEKPPKIAKYDQKVCREWNDTSSKSKSSLMF